MILLEVGDFRWASEDGFITSDGIKYEAGIRGLSSVYNSVGSVIKPLLSLPSVTVQMNKAAVLDIELLVGKAATVRVGETVLPNFQVLAQGKVFPVHGGQSADRRQITVRSDVANPSIIYANDQLTGLGTLAVALLAAAAPVSFTMDFTDWLADPDQGQGKANIATPRPVLDLVAQAAFEDFRDLLIDGNTIKAISRDPDQPSDQVVIRKAFQDRYQIQINPRDETCNRLNMVFEDEILTFEDDQSIAAIGVMEKTVQPLFVQKARAGEWAARFLHRFAALQIYLDCELEGLFRPGDQFLAAFENPTAPTVAHLDGDRYQVRHAAYRHETRTTRLQAWEVRTDPGTFQPLVPVRRVERESAVSDLNDLSDLIDPLEPPSNGRRFDQATDSSHLGILFDKAQSGGRPGGYEIQFRKSVDQS